MRSLVPVLLALIPATTMADRISAPAEGTPQEALLESVRMIADGEYERFIANYCHPGLLCASREAVLRLQRDILPKARPVIASCLKGSSRGVEVLGMEGDPSEHEARLVYGLECGGRTHTIQVHRFKAKWWVASF